MPTTQLYTEGLNGERLPSGAGLEAIANIKYHLAKLYTLAVRNNVDLDEFHLLIEKGSKEYAGRAQRERDMNEHHAASFVTYYDRYIRPVQQPIPPNNNAYTEAHFSPFKRTNKLSDKPLAPIVPDEVPDEGEE